jgi:hypothetical protein
MQTKMDNPEKQLKSSRGYGFSNKPTHTHYTIKDYLCNNIISKCLNTD